MLKYISAGTYFRNLFGCKVYKLALGCSDTCPTRNPDGSGGCIFCGKEGSGEFAETCMSAAEVSGAISRAKKRVAAKTSDNAYIAYFQSYTSTFIPAVRLKEVLSAAAAEEGIRAISIATRPDCLPDDVMRVLSETASTLPLFVELGLQTMHDRTAKLIKRGYDLKVYEDAAIRLKNAGANVITHVILGLPGESAEDAAQSARYAGELTDGIKLQLLYVLRGTELCDMYARGKYRPLEMHEYVQTLCGCVKALPSKTVVHRLTGDPPKRLLVAPDWAADKKRVLSYINAEFEKQGIIRI